MTARPLLPLPNGLKPLSHQTAGHFYGKGVTNLGFLEKDDGTLLKPVEASKRGQRELNFYRCVFDEGISDHVILQLRSLVPNFLGVWTTPEHPGVTYINLEDVTRKFRQPNILDVKVGRITYEPEAGEEKILHEELKYPHIQKTCFQTIGMMTYNEDTGKYQRYPRNYLLSLDDQDILWKGLARFVNYKSGRHHAVVRRLISQLENIQDWFNTQNHMAFYASSLLLVYDACDTQSKDNTLNTYNKGKCDHDCHVDIKNKYQKEDTASKISSERYLNGDNVIESQVHSIRVSDYNNIENSEQYTNGDFISEKQSSNISTCLNDEGSLDSFQNCVINDGAVDAPTNEHGVSRCKNDAISCKNAINTDKHIRTNDGDKHVVLLETVGDISGSDDLKLIETRQDDKCDTPFCTSPRDPCNCDKTKHDVILDGSPAKNLDKLESDIKHEQEPLVDVRMIDFVRVYPTGDKDDNYIDGITSLIAYLHRLL